jgi:hypothetical protein
MFILWLCTSAALVFCWCLLLARAALAMCLCWLLSATVHVLFCSDVSPAATGRCPGYTCTLAPCWLCTGFVMMLALSWLIPGTALATLSMYLCWPFPGAALAAYFRSLGSWLPLICWAGPWLYLGFAPAPRWYDSDFWLTLL